MSACIQCGSVIENEALTGMVCQNCSNNMSGVGKGAPKIDPLVQGAFVSGGLGLFISLEVNDLDYAALGFGSVAIALGLVGLIRFKSAPSELHKVRIGTAIGAILLGAFHISRTLSVYYGLLT